ncbi:MAG: hypothetical protein MUE38_07580, partial [Flavihumibacter sp.]|nr:hypothetical protein [Flavihumibacter sp.]
MAGLLLLLYCFISLPVILWHHHVHSECQQDFKQETTNSVSKLNGGESKSCSVCDHEYATYTDEHGFRFLSAVVSWETTSPTTIHELRRYELSNQSYRGPP